MKLHYFFGCILAAPSLAVWPEIGLAHGGGGHGGEVEDTLLSVVVTHLADSPAVALVGDSAGRGDFLLVDFLVAERKPTRTGQVPFLNSGEFSWRSPRFS